MQLKSKLKLMLVALIIIGASLFLLLRNKRDPIVDDPLNIVPDTVPVTPLVSDEPEQPTPTTNPAKPIVPNKPTAPIKLPTPEPQPEPELPVQPTPTTNPAKPIVPNKPTAPIKLPTPEPQPEPELPIQATPTTNPAKPLTSISTSLEVPLLKSYGKACVAPNIIKQWTGLSGVNEPNFEMTYYCNNNDKCAFIWAEPDGSTYYACNGNGTFSYRRNNWLPQR